MAINSLFHEIKHLGKIQTAYEALHNFLGLQAQTPTELQYAG